MLMCALKTPGSRTHNPVKYSVIQVSYPVNVTEHFGRIRSK